MSLLSWIRGLFAPEPYVPTGLIPDARSSDEKELDYRHEELAGAAAPVYRDAPPPQLGPVEDQRRTSSCVAHGTTLAASVALAPAHGGFVRLAKVPLYRLRQSYPAEGMWLQGAAQLLRSFGAPPYDLSPDLPTEPEANALQVTPELSDAAKPYSGLNYVSVGAYDDIDTLSGLVNDGTPVAVIFYATSKEWGQEYPRVLDYGLRQESAPVRHCVCAVPNGAFIEHGVKYLTIQDSAHFGGLSTRYVSEDFITCRFYGALYFQVLKPATPSVKPRHTFTQTLKVGAAGADVVALQDCLAYEGTFVGKSTGYFGGITAKAVRDFQVRYKEDILQPAGLTAPTGVVGAYTRAKLNQIYGS